MLRDSVCPCRIAVPVEFARDELEDKPSADSLSSAGLVNGDIEPRCSCSPCIWSGCTKIRSGMSDKVCGEHMKGSRRKEVNKSSKACGRLSLTAVLSRHAIRAHWLDIHYFHETSLRHPVTRAATRPIGFTRVVVGVDNSHH